ncbi:MAG: hypothetical protein ACI9WU_001220 [Myxococcota bacterium]|jgi:hypothetical protein
MRRLAFAALLAGGLILGGCGSDDGEETTTAGTTDGATTDTTDTTGTGDAGTTATGDDTTGGDTTGADTTGGEPTGGATTGTDTGGGDTGDTGLPVLPDGKQGSPCESSADCESEDDYLCLFGMCAAICRIDGEPVPNACDGEVSNASEYDSWSCPDDLIICMPAAGYQGKNAICPNENYCKDTFGAASSCAGPIPLGGGIVMQGLCFPWGDRGATGDACETGDDCGSNVCLNDADGNPTVCSALCSQNKQCQDGAICQGLSIDGPEATEDDPDPITQYFAPLCVEVPGSLTYCFNQAQCGDDEVCNASVEPNSVVPQYHCIDGNAGGGAAGAACATAADCASGFCLGGGIEGVSGYCTNTCQKKPEDCGDGTFCGKATFHDNGTSDTGDDKVYGLCMFGQAGDWCLVGDGKWCEDPLSECVQDEALEEGVGMCSTPPNGCAEGAPCSDGLTCTVDGCDMDANECDFSVLEAETCLIDGMCYAAGDANAANACMICDPATSADAWTPGAEAVACTGDDMCMNYACDAAGACQGTTKDCDDGLTCTEDGCNGDTGECVADIMADTCLIEGVCYAAGETASANDCMECVGAAPEAWSIKVGGCDDGDGCTEADQCDEAGVCQPGTDMDCDDASVCTADSCVEGACVNAADAGAVGMACDDGDICTGEDTCDAAGACLGTATDCDDVNDCTTDSCGVDGVCVNDNMAMNTACDDGDLCTMNDVCDAAGACQSGADMDCGDGNACTSDNCDAGICANPADASAVGSSCADDDACTFEDTCDDAGGCAGLDMADDGLTCTMDSCTAGVVTNTQMPSTCLMENMCYADGEVKADDACQFCNPEASTTAWSPQPDNTECGLGLICSAGVCIGD